MSEKHEEYTDTQKCPGCDRDILDYLSTCPHCQYNIDEGHPAEIKETKKRGRKPKEAAVATVPVTQEPKNKPKGGWVPANKSLVYVPALGRMGRRDPIDFPELHWRKDEPVTDESLIDWAERLRYAYPAKGEDGQGWLSNHAIGYFAEQAKGPHDKVLRENAKKIVELIGGDDWKK